MLSNTKHDFVTEHNKNKVVRGTLKKYFYICISFQIAVENQWKRNSDMYDFFEYSSKQNFLSNFTAYY